jgi:hypothetical protein
VLSGAETGAATSYTPDVVAKSREHLQKAISLRPDYPESYRLLAFVSLVTGERVEESIAAIKSVLNVSPGRHDFINMLAQLYMRKEDFKTARTLFEQVLKSNADEENKKVAEQILATISTYEQSLARVEEARKSAMAGGSQPVIVGAGPEIITQQQSTDPSSYLREVLRKPAAGETQVQAKLVKIECDAKGIVFVVQTETELLRLRTTKFEDIDITTFDPKVGGDITCGPWKGQAVVIVCYVPGADKRLKVYGVLKSVEFVPADFKL